MGYSSWRKETRKKGKQPKTRLGLFRGLCASVVAGEILHHMTELRNGDSNYPLVVFVDHQHNTLTKFPGFQKLWKLVIPSSG